MDSSPIGCCSNTLAQNTNRQVIPRTRMTGSNRPTKEIIVLFYFSYTGRILPPALDVLCVKTGLRSVINKYFAASISTAGYDPWNTHSQIRNFFCAADGIVISKISCGQGPAECIVISAGVKVQKLTASC